MTWAFVIQTTVSALAILGLVALAGWARIAAPRPPLDAAAARAVLAEEFPDSRIGAVWIAADGRAAVARAGEEALIVWLRGDDYVARQAPWSALATAQVSAGTARLAFHDVAAPAARLAVGALAPWPPALEALTLEAGA
ncbi:MAG: hypothetical protein P4L73_17510 [Caulobacteraceae bacterium]|nr:hypothetical protein [Caulobacteraceae bacterium]